MKKNGFTLVETMIVVAIIALLAAIAVPSFCEARSRALLKKSQGIVTNVVRFVPTSFANYTYWIQNGKALEPYEISANTVSVPPSGQTIEVDKFEILADAGDGNMFLSFNFTNGQSTASMHLRTVGDIDYKAYKD